MKNLSKSLLLVALLIGYSLPAFSQASTQGTDFWVALIPCKGPDSSNPADTKQFSPYIAVSALEPCSVTVSNPRTGWSKQYQIKADNLWLEIKDIPLTQWFQNTIPSSEQPYDNGLFIKATKEVSVYSCLQWSKSMDAANVLPVTALQSNYKILTYPPSAKDGDHSNVFTVLATEDCTVNITPSVATIGNHTAGTPFAVNLKKGQVYHVISKADNNISGSEVDAKGTPIAVFTGCILGNVPTTVADRDLLYEQMFATDYWGTDFVITRSLEKDANRVLIMAQENGTEVSIYGSYQPTLTSATISPDKVYTLILQAGETFEFELSEGYAEDRWNKRPNDTGINVIGKSTYIHASCPCAVMSCDVGDGYKWKSGGEQTGGGAPSMTWVSPIQQMMKEVVFGVMGTTNTHTHFLNVIIPTSETANFSLTDKDGKAVATTFETVTSKTEYSFARVKLAATSTGKANPIYHITCPGGFIATVYGNGSDESYAYSVGSSAIILGSITVGKQTFDITRNFSNIPYCVNEDITFDASAGSTVIDKVTWDFGDGVTKTISSASTTHKYTTPGWYDVTATLYAHKECPDTVYPGFDVNFSFRVDRPDTLYRNVTLCADSVPKYRFDEIPNSHTFAMQDPTVDEIIVDTITSDGDCSNVYILTINAIAKRESDIDLDDIYPLAQRRDSALIPADGYDTGEGLGLYHPTAEYVYTGGYYVRHYYRSNTKCDSTVTYHVTVVKCLDLKAENTQQTVCYMDSIHNLTFSYDRDGNPGSMDLWIDGKKNCPIIFGDKDSKVDDGVSRIHISASAVPVKVYPGYHKAVIKMKDINCDTIAESEPFNLTVLYPDSIFAYKFDNVLTMYKKGHGGNIPGWDFVRYEWYHNDDTIPCGTGPVYHTDEPFTIGDTYYVVLTRTDGMVLRSCEFEIQNHGGIERSGKGNAPDSDGNDTGNMPAANAPAKFIQNRQLYILFEGAVYNMYGQRVKSND